MRVGSPQPLHLRHLLLTKESILRHQYAHCIAPDGSIYGSGIWDGSDTIVGPFGVPYTIVEETRGDLLVEFVPALTGGSPVPLEPPPGDGDDPEALYPEGGVDGITVADVLSELVGVTS